MKHPCIAAPELDRRYPWTDQLSVMYSCTVTQE